MKTYTSKSNARRALKAVGDYAFAKAESLIIEVDGKWGFNEEAAELAQYEGATGQQYNPDTAEVESAPEVDVAALEKQADKELEAQLNEEAAQAVEAGTPKVKADVKHKSDIELPTKAVWHIADEMKAADPEVRRKDVIAECVRRGIAFYTARTQYQQWLQVQREQREREAQMAAGK